MASMLMEFETLDTEDIKDIMSGNWSEEKKREKIRSAEKLQMKKPPPPPVKQSKEMNKEPSDSSSMPDPEQT